MNSFDTRDIRPEFNLRRHAVLEPYKDHIKNFMLNHIVYERYGGIGKNNIFLSGECIAWLLERFDEFTRIDILIVITRSQEYGMTATPEALLDGFKCGLPQDSDFPSTLENMYGLSNITVNCLGMNISLVFIHGIQDLTYENFSI